MKCYGAGGRCDEPYVWTVTIQDGVSVRRNVHFVAAFCEAHARDFRARYANIETVRAAAEGPGVQRFTQADPAGFTFGDGSEWKDGTL
jgi:hypothetical protein